MRLIIRKPAFSIYAKTKTVTAQLISAFVFAIRIVQSYNPCTAKIGNFKHLSIFCGCTAWFVSDLVGNPEDRFSHNGAIATGPEVIKRFPFSTQLGLKCIYCL